MGWFVKTTKQLLATSLLIGLSGCGGSDPQALKPAVGEPSGETTRPAPGETVASPQPQASPQISPTPQQDYFHDAVNRASSAVAIGQSAHSNSDWQLAASRWEQAIQLMQQVPNSSPDYATAQAKIQEYQTHLAAAQQRAQGEPPLATAKQPDPPDNGLVAQIPILRRRGGTPVVPVSMKGQKGTQEFTMLFDTGATGTLITPAMANALGVVVVDQATVTIADGSQVTMPIGYVDYIEVGGFRREGVLVAIGGDVGLLGQDMYGEFGISLGARLINLYR